MITIFGELYSSKNSRQISFINGKPVLLKSKQCRKGEKEMACQMVLLRKHFIEMCQDSEKPLRVYFKIYRKTNRIFDYVNIIQSFLDLMVKYEWIKDDNANEIIPVFDTYEVDKNNPRIEIKVL